jgi:hypothetical protein
MTLPCRLHSRSRILRDYSVNEDVTVVGPNGQKQSCARPSSTTARSIGGLRPDRVPAKLSPVVVTMSTC